MSFCFKTIPIIFIITLLCSGLVGCRLPMNHNKPEASFTVENPYWLNEAGVQEKLDEGLTAYLGLDDAFISIASRIYLIRHAQHHLDLQYYIWKDDFIGHLMLSELLKAADRGVKVRLLLDDQNGTQLDPTLKILVNHPNIQIRFFNPYKFRHLRVLDYIFRLKHVNHRMHNKLIIADGVIAVTGGRNISSEYFDASEQFQFTDMDILFYGHAVEHANAVYLEFWNDRLSYAVQQFIGSGNEQHLEQLRQKYAAYHLNDQNVEDKIRQAQELLKVRLQEDPVEWAVAHFVADSPKKITGQATGNELIYHQMYQLMGQPKQHLELVSAYFVPTQRGEQYLSSLANRGVNVRILTNSFLANDVAVVHAFYQKYRKDLLKNGVQLYEFKPYIHRDKPTWYELITGNIIPAKGKNNSSLHAKFFDIDGKVFIGSFNFDPRSANLNSEVGLVVESDRLQDRVSQSLDQYLPQIAYQLKLDAQGEIIWIEYKADGKQITHNKEPESNRFQRFMIKFAAIFPVEWLM
ncbi:phospholipase D family protein [Acinetobacter puyangensis]|uniref:phospholipase D family protein n=1 Tax=Acinetobacter puyangensis TaxID=1096779 RepID=UPI003A4DD8A6